MNELGDFSTGFGEGVRDFGNNLSIIVNSVLLLIAYLIGVGITSLIAKIFGKHFLEMKLLKKEKTYWSNLNLKKKPIDEYYRQF